MSRRRQDAGFQRRAMVQPCPRCGALAPLLGREMFAKYRDGVCARCLAENLDTLMKGFREMGAVVGRFLNERGVTKPNEVLPRGEALYQALQKAAGPICGCDTQSAGPAEHDGPAAGPIQPPAHPPGPCPDCRGHEGCCGDA